MSMGIGMVVSRRFFGPLLDGLGDYDTLLCVLLAAALFFNDFFDSMYIIHSLGCLESNST